MATVTTENFHFVLNLFICYTWVSVHEVVFRRMLYELKRRFGITSKFFHWFLLFGKLRISGVNNEEKRKFVLNFYSETHKHCRTDLRSTDCKSSLTKKSACRIYSIV